MEEFYENEYTNLDLSDDKFKSGTYELCNFVNCNLNEANLSGSMFLECSFESCDLSMAKVNKTAFRDVNFKSCKMLGLQLENCNTFLMEFVLEDCILNFSTFASLKLNQVKFINCTLEEVDFTECDLTKVKFDNCNLTRAIFANTLLEGADLSTAFGFSIDPQNNYIRKAIFSRNNVEGLLGHFGIEIID